MHERSKRRIGLVATAALVLLFTWSAGGQGTRPAREPSQGSSETQTATTTRSLGTGTSSVSGALPRLHGVPPKSSSLGLDAELKRQMKSLEAKRAETEVALRDLRLAEERIQARIAELKAACPPPPPPPPIIDEKLTHLAKIAQRMPAKDAAKFMLGFEEDVAASILGLMSVAKAAPVIAAMDAERAASLGKRYLERGPAPSTITPGAQRPAP